MSRFVLGAFFCAVLPGILAVAQEPSLSQPYAQVDVGSREVMVGKPVQVTVTLMVPTMFRVQPEFPDYDGINVIVKTSGPDMRPIDKFINGSMWFGSSQTYWFYPMQPGKFVFEAMSASGVYSDPEKSVSATADFAIEGFTFSAVIPDGAEKLDPLIVADSLTLEQSWEGTVESMEAGETISRIVSADIEGSSVLFLPSLIPTHDTELVKTYLQPFKVTETGEGKGSGGVRTESVTYLAQYGGEMVFPDLAITWFNTKTGEVEVASVKGRRVVIDATEKPVEPLVSRKQALLLLGLILCVFAMGWGYRKFLHPALKRVIAELRTRWSTSEPQAARAVLQAIRSHDLDEVFRSIVVWQKRQSGKDSEARQAFLNALGDVGRERFGAGPEADWQELEQTFRQMRQAAKFEELDQCEKVLPGLNVS